MTDVEWDMPENQDDGYFSEEASTFGDRVAAGRRAIGLTQQQLSQKLGIKLKTLLAWEEDISEPRANKLQMLSGVLNVSLIWLLTGEGEGVNDPWSEELGPTVEQADVVAEMRAVRGEIQRLGSRIALLEKRLSASFRAGG